MARQLSSVVGHKHITDKILSSLKIGKLFSSAIFSGPEGVGKKKVALGIAQEANCQTIPACGVCASCVRFLVIPNEGYMLLEPSGDKIKIEQVREVLEYLSLRSELPNRFIIIDQAEKLTVQAANALLKSIEEPPEGVHFILITSNLSMLLPTIRSRCQVFSFSGLTEKELVSLVPELAPWQVLWSFGRVSLAQKIVQEEWLDLRKTSINFLHKPGDKAVYDALYKDFSESQKAEYIFHTWMTYLRDSLTVQENASTALYNKDIENFVRKFAENRKIREGIDALFLAREDYSGNVDKNLILENLALTLGA
ncbi:MAG: AAA family ATPase [Bdellovibrionaceae bacterium]|nr:AAA family ATPase [Pseudobdellovibrionaceae bacterium]